jgi:hypothetical protein
VESWKTVEERERPSGKGKGAMSKRSEEPKSPGAGGRKKPRKNEKKRKKREAGKGIADWAVTNEGIGDPRTQRGTESEHVPMTKKSPKPNRPS